MKCTLSLNKKYQGSLIVGIFNAAIKKNMRQNHRNMIHVTWSLKSRRLLGIWSWTGQKRGLEHPEKKHRSSLKESELPVSLEMTKKARSALYQHLSVRRECVRTRQSYSTSSGAACVVHIALYFCEILVIKHYFHTWKECTSGDRDAINSILQPTKA